MTLPSELDPRTRRGKPTRLTRETLDAIVQAIEQGSYLKIAAQAAGVAQSTLAGWLARGREAHALTERHNPDDLYCPDCDLDRTGEVDTLTALNAEPNPVGAVLARCHRCGSDAYPIDWTLPEQEQPYVELLESVTRAQAVAEVAAVAAWRKAWGDDWRAARDYLARTAPERWAGVTRVQMTTEESERRVEDAVDEALKSLGPLGGILDGEDADLDDGGDDQ